MNRASSLQPRSGETSPPVCSPAPSPEGVRSITSGELLGASGELVISHRGRQYRLRVTQNDKLILTA